MSYIPWQEEIVLKSMVTQKLLHRHALVIPECCLAPHVHWPGLERSVDFSGDFPAARFNFVEEILEQAPWTSIALANLGEKYMYLDLRHCPAFLCLTLAQVCLQTFLLFLSYLCHSFCANRKY